MNWRIHSIIWVVVLLHLSNLSITQNRYTVQPEYDTRIHFWDRTFSKKGVVVDINEKGIAWIDKNSFRSIMISEPQYQPKRIAFNRIKALSFHKKGNVGKNILFGALIGGVVGGLAAVGTNNNSCSGSYFCVRFSDSQAFAGGFLLGGMGGALIGGLITPILQKRILINGKYSSYVKNKEQIDKYILMYPSKVPVPF